MKILEFVRLFNEPTATFIYNEITELAALGHDVTVACLTRMEADRYPFPQVEILPLSPVQRRVNYGLSRLGLRMNFRNRAFCRNLERLVERFRPDVIHCHYGPDALFVLDNWKRNDIPVFISFHGYDASSLLHKRVYRGRLREIFRRPSVFPLFVSHVMRRGVEKRGIPVDRSLILYYGTDVTFFQRRQPAPPRDPFVFLQVSSFREKKGHEYTLRAFARLCADHPGRSVRLVLAGDGPLLDRMRQQTQELGMADRVVFPGFVTPLQAREWMEQAHAFVHHSVTAPSDGDMEGIPNALMEAMAMELPILSTRHSGIPELVEDGVNGFLVEERDVNAYARRMYDILDWPLQPGNRQKVAAQFERRRHAEQLADYYRQAVDQLKNEKKD